jgi:Mrp family chromosome partitioning ATPase
MMAAHGVHQIRMLLERRFQPGRTPVFAITSSTAGAGKTSLSLALGLSFAASGSRTLLIDCDIIGGGLTSRMKKGSRRRIGHVLRRLGLINTEQLIAALKESKERGEKIGETLVRHGCVTEADVAHALEVQQSAVVGLREALNGDPANECITGVGTNHLFLMPLGSARRQHVAQLSCPALLRVLEQVRGWFDVILIDTGPILGSLEAGAAVMAADETVMTVARGEHRHMIDRAIEQLHAAGGRLAGIVLNRVSVGDIISSGMSSSTSRMSTGDKEPPPLPTIAEIDHHTLRLGPISNAVIALADYSNGDHNLNPD